MIMIDLEIGWLKIIQVPCLGLEYVTSDNSEYIEESYERAIPMLNQIWLSRYPLPQKFTFDNKFGLKIYFLPLFKYFK